MASLSSSSQNVMFTGKGDVDAFIAKIEVLNKLKKYEGEEASRLEESAFNVYLRLWVEDKKDFTKIRDELLKGFQRGNRDREEALSLLSTCQRNEGESAQDIAFRISRLVHLAYSSFTEAQRQVHEKDFFVKGLHPDMEVHLKSLEAFATSDMKALLDHTVRLEVAGVKSFRRKLTEEMNTVQEIRDDQIADFSRALETRIGDLEDAIANLNVGNRDFRGRRSQGNFRGRGQRKNGRSCFNCGDKSHFVRQCPNRYCQSCGGTGHDAWNRNCPKNS